MMSAPGMGNYPAPGARRRNVPLIIKQLQISLFQIICGAPEPARNKKSIVKDARNQVHRHIRCNLKGNQRGK